MLSMHLLHPYFIKTKPMKVLKVLEKARYDTGGFGLDNGPQLWGHEMALNLPEPQALTAKWR